MKRLLILGAAVAGLFGAASTQAQGVRYALDLSSLAQIDANVRQVTYFIHGVEDYPIKVVVQINCLTLQEKLIQLGEGANQRYIPSDEPWYNAAADREARDRFGVICGEKGTNALKAKAASKPAS